MEIPVVESEAGTESMSSLKDVFTHCQDDSMTEPFVAQMLKIYEEIPYDDFFREIRQLLLLVFVHVGPEDPVNQIFQVITKFASKLDKQYVKTLEGEDGTDEDDQDLHPFSEDLFSFLLEMQVAAFYSVRQRSLHLMSKLFKELNELPCEGHLWNKLYIMADERLRDTSAHVRAQAVLTYCYLQDPTASACPIIKEFLFLMSRDPSHMVRRNVTNTIAVTSKTLLPLLNRLKDVNSAVRKTAILRISEKVSVNCFTVKQRMEIVKSCVNDPSSDVQQALKHNLVPAWLKTCNDNIIAFLNLLDVQTAPDIVRHVVNIVFERVDVRTIAESLELNPEHHLVPQEKLTTVQSFLWASLCQFVKTMTASFAIDLFDDITPTITDFCDYFEKYLDTFKSENGNTQSSFILQQILSLATELDFADIFGQKKLHVLVTQTLKSNICSLDMVKPLIVCIRSMEQNRKKFIQEVIELVEEIYKLMLMEKAETTNEDSLLTIQKALKILIETFKISVVCGVTNEMIEMKEMVILPNISHENDEIRLLAIEALGLYCMCSVEEARTSYGCFMQAIISGEPEVQVIGLKAAFDMLIIFGSKLLVNLENSEDSKEPDESLDLVSARNHLASFMEKFIPLLESPDEEVQYVAVEGVAKVMICQQISSPVLFSKLCVIRFHPYNEDDTKLKNCIDAFMTEYAESKALTADCLIETFMAIIEMIFEDPADSEVAQIDGLSVLTTLLQIALLMPPVDANDVEGSIVHDVLAMKICDKILEVPDADYVPSLIRVFSHFSNTPAASDDLISAIGKVQDEVDDKKSMRTMSKYLCKLNEARIMHREEVFFAPRQLSFSQRSSQSVIRASKGDTSEDDIGTDSSLKKDGENNDVTFASSIMTIPLSESDKNEISQDISESDKNEISQDISESDKNEISQNISESDKNEISQDTSESDKNEISRISESDKNEISHEIPESDNDEFTQETSKFPKSELSHISESGENEVSQEISDKDELSPEIIIPESPQNALEKTGDDEVFLPSDDEMIPDTPLDAQRPCKML